MSHSINDCFVIVIGETGSGKSTFINYVATALHKNSSLDTLQVVIPNEHYPNSSSFKWKHNERAVDDPTLSKTAECQLYTFPSTNGKGSLVLIDTPGLGDTSGHLKDNENVNMIFQTIKSLQQISAIILLLNGTTPRMTSNVNNVLMRFRQFFPDSIYPNMIVVLTNCQKYNTSFDHDSLSLPSTCRFFYMQNSAYCQPSHMIKAHRADFERDYKESMGTMHTIIEYLLQLKPQTTKAFADLDDDRYRLQAFLHESYLIILQMEQLEHELKSLKKAADIAEINVENLLQRNKILVLTMVPKNYYNIICSQCSNICHKNCKLNEVSGDGDNPVSTCIKMKGDRCTQCRCSVKRHYYGSKDMEQVNLTIPESIVRAEQRLRFEREDHVLTMAKYNSVESIRNQIPNLLNRQCDRIRQKCMDLKKSCQRINIAQELNNFIQTLNQGRLQFQSPSVINRLNYLIQELERIVSNSQQTGKKNGADNLHSDTQIQNTVEESSSLLLLQRDEHQVAARPPPYYRPDPEPELHPVAETVQKPPIQPQCYSTYTTERLIGAHQELVRMNSEHAKRTLDELQQRAKGSSVGLLNRYELGKFANYYADRRHHKKNDLQDEYDTLAKEIDTDINHDASNLEAIETNDLLKLAALSLLIDPVPHL